MPNTTVDEPSRLAALEGYEILDTLPESGFDEIVKLARQICRTPVALISFVASDRQWFKATAGTELCQTPIEQSVCAHALAQFATLVIPDLTKDERTKRNALVTGEPYMRFYAGAVLTNADGFVLGTLCVIDVEPRPEGLTKDQIDALEILARQTMLLLELRKESFSGNGAITDPNERMGAIERRKQVSSGLIVRLQDNERRLRLAQEAGQIGTFEIDIEKNVLYPSQFLCSLFGVPYRMRMTPSELEGLVIPEDRSKVSSAQGRAEASSLRDVEYRIRRADNGQEAWLSRRAEFLEADGRPSRMYGVVRDITKQKNAEALQSELNQEISHRLKNALFVVIGIANQTLKDIPREMRAGFVDRVVALSKAHEVLLRGLRESAPIRAIVEEVLKVVVPLDRIVFDGPDVLLSDTAALSASMLFHELATNAVKYGALSQGGRVTVSWGMDDSDLRVRWVEKGGPTVVPPLKTGSGTRLIQMGLLGRKAELAFEPDGLRVEFHAPLSEAIVSAGRVQP